jgi:hypothetical protein
MLIAQEQDAPDLLHHSIRKGKRCTALSPFFLDSLKNYLPVFAFHDKAPENDTAG